LERVLEIGPKRSEIALDAAGAADQDMVGARDAPVRQDLAGEGTEPPLHPIADDRAADLLRHSDAEADRRIAVLPVADEQDEAGRRGPAAAISRQEIGASGDGGEGSGPGRLRSAASRFAQADSVLRPRARRAARTLRPPGVALRARKPWRRLRTRRLGWKVRFISHSSNLEIKRAAK
jgi:hypothetical protein